MGSKTKKKDKVTLDQLMRVVPKSRRTNVSQKTVDKMNGVIKSSIAREAMKDNMLSYMSVLKEGRFKMDDYINAVKYCTLKLCGNTDIESWTKTFPERYQRLVDKNIPPQQISAHATMYNKTVMVVKIIEQTLVPIHLLNVDIHQRAINAQADLMINAKSEMVRMNAANSLLTHLKPPETQQIDLNIGIKEDDSIKDLRDTTLELVAQQKKMLAAGAMTIKEVAHSKIVSNVVDAEVIDND